MICQLVQQIRLESAVRDQQLISRARGNWIGIPSRNLHADPHNRSTGRRCADLELRLIVSTLVAIERMI